MDKLSDLIPLGTDIPWKAIESVFGDFLAPMGHTPQNPQWHGEGDVLTHTKMMLKALVELAAYQALDTKKQQAVFLAALLHDIGKPKCTRMEDGKWVSRGHGIIGAEMARQALWLELGLCGTPEKQQLRETVCDLIRYHSAPVYAIDDPDGKRRLMRIAANGVQVPDFTLELLCLLSQADVTGRISDDKARQLEQIDLCRELARESGCYDRPFAFPSAHTKYAYLSGKNIQPEQTLYDDTWGEVILLSGLPGTGKDTWIQENLPDVPMVSLDGIRREMGLAPEKNQTPAVEEGRKRAMEYLRKKQSFVWNATDLSPMVRQKQIDLFTAYHGAVRIVYLETPWQEQLRRNRERQYAVPESAICHMLSKLIPPEDHEAHRVQWYCT